MLTQGVGVAEVAVERVPIRALGELLARGGQALLDRFAHCAPFRADHLAAAAFSCELDQVGLRCFGLFSQRSLSGLSACRPSSAACTSGLSSRCRTAAATNCSTWSALM